MGLLKLLLLAATALYAAVVLGIFLLQRDLQYFPGNVAPPPEKAGLSGVEVARLLTPDGESLVLWYAPAPANRPTILFFHGNAGEIADRADRFAFYRDNGYGVAFLSYRGYGGSTGTISQAGLITDATTAYDWLIAKGIPAERIVLVGESLGTGVAVQLAAARPVAAVLLGAPYSSTVDIAAEIYWWLPVGILMKDQFRSIDHIGAVSAPLLVVHGTEDRVIPLRFGERLFAAAREPKRFVPLAGAGHGAISAPTGWRHEMAFLAEILPE